MKLQQNRNRIKNRFPRQVQTKSGTVEGKQLQCDKGPVDVFLGIPYAKPPVGERRFKKPSPISPWVGVLKCKRYRSRAPQIDYIWDRLDLRVGKSEDCLYLNIITPGWKPSQECGRGYPILFYIHGGGFVVDSAVKYHYSKIARLLVPHDIIVVTIQYRLGFLGFFTTGDNICPGNFGIWDQHALKIMALKWVKENIVCFGGDPNRITVVGQSAGAVSADLLALSPHSRGFSLSLKKKKITREIEMGGAELICDSPTDLFNQVVLLGGNAECPWAISNSSKVADYCLRHAEKLGWHGNKNMELIHFLRDLPAAKLADGMIGNKEMFTTGRLPLTPVIDGDLIPGPIAELRKQAPTKPSFVGVTQDEGLLFVAMGRLSCDLKDVELGIKIMTDAVEGSGIDARKVINEIYFGNDNNLHDRQLVRRAFVDILGDLTSNYGTSLYVDKLVQRGETVYMFSLEHCNPACYGLLNFYLPYRTATHGIELIYLFDANIYVSPFFKTALDKQITRIMTQTVANFVKKGNPNVTNDDLEHKKFIWQPVTIHAKEQHLRIAQVTEMRTEFKNGRIKRLKDIFGNVNLK